MFGVPSHSSGFQKSLRSGFVVSNPDALPDPFTLAMIPSPESTFPWGVFS